MRSLTRLLIELRKNEKNSKASLENYVCPQKFDAVVEAVKSPCCNHSDKYKQHSFHVPSLALKIGHHLKKCAQLVRGLALGDRDQVRANVATDFIELEWSVWISSYALSTLHKNQWSKPGLLPCATDLVKLRKYQQSSMNILMKDIERQPSKAAWRDLAEITATSISLQ